MTRDEFMEFLRGLDKKQEISQEEWVKEINALYDKIEKWMETAASQELVQIIRNTEGKYPQLKIITPAQEIDFIPTGEQTPDRGISLFSRGREATISHRETDNGPRWYAIVSPYAVGWNGPKDLLDESVFYAMMIEVLR